MAVDILVLGLVVVVLTVVVYALATLGTKETPYEEALAEQRQKQEQENAQTKPEKQYKYKKDKYQVKKRAPVRKDGAETNDSAAEASAEEVALVEPEAKKKKEVAQRKVVESVVVKAEAPKVENAKGKSPKVESKKEQAKATKVETKKEQAKPPKVEAKKEPAKAAKVEAKEEPIKVTKVETKQAKPSKPETKKEAAKGKAAKAEEAKVEPVVEKAKAQKTEAEAPKVEASPESTPPPPAKENEKEKSAPAAAQTIVEETPDVVDATVVVATGKATPTQEKKKKKDKPTAAATNKTLPMLQCAGLTSGEIQTYIDILLNEQQRSNAGGEWQSKGRVDPITQLRRQLEDVESQLKEKDEAHSALSAKITSLRTELNGERSKATKLKTQLEETAANHTKQLEIATTSAQNSQAATIKELKATLETEYQEKLQQQQTILQQLQSTQNDGELATLRTSLSEAEMQAASLKQERDELDVHYKEHIRGLEEKYAAETDMRNDVSNAQLTELQEKVASLDAQRAQALSEASQVEIELTNEKARTAQIQHNLQEAVQEKARIEGRLGQVEGELDSVQQVVVDQTAQIERLKEEKESLASQSVRPAAEGQENGDIHAEQAQGPTTAELDLIVKEKEIQIEQQLTEVSNLKKEITRLREDLDSQKAKNNEASGEVEEEKTKVRAVLRRICPEVVVDDALDQGAFLSEFEAKALQVITQSSQTAQPPAPEVVEVEKVVEKVIEVEKIVEKIVEDESLKAKVEELLSENSQLKTQVEELKSSVSAATSAADDSKRVSELEEEVRTVGEKVVHYQTVLADTENLLKSLQASVESEEVTWNKRLSEKDVDIRQLTADKANLELQVKQYENTLDKVKEAEEMQTQLKQMQEQLQSESKDKAALQEELLKAQEQLTQTATKDSSGEEEASLEEKANLEELRADNDKLRALVNVGQESSRQQEQVIEQLQTELASVKNASMNGPAVEEQSPEDNTSRADTASLMSASSASVTDPTNLSQAQSEGPSKKSKKKRKGAGAKE